jgi:dipeptidyl aminopeptidase/acylaminoacyl peptidase
MVYPAWYPDGHHLAVMNSSASADPNPCSTRIDRKGQTQESPLAGFQVYGGMPSVNQQYPYLLAFAGQLIPRLPAPYNENFNYVWVADAQTGTVAPLDRNAPQDRYDPAYQSRAPWWSPDGRWVAFESNRLCPGAGTGMGYALFLQDAEGLKPPIQVTDPDWDAQHAKWIDDGTLVATLFQKRSSKKVPRGIATLDVSALISG